jgi:uncharacterized membrane protein
MIIKLVFASILLTFLDSIYINLTKKRYMQMITSIQKENVNINLFGLFMSYFFLILGLYFIIKNKLDYKDAFLIGLVIYGVYDMTNLAIFKNWSVLNSILDITWGAFLFGITIFLVNIVFKK